MSKQDLQTSVTAEPAPKFPIPPETAKQISAIQDRRLAKRQVREAKREEQRLIDLAAIEALEEEHDQLGTASVNVYAEGLPVLVAFRCPTEHEAAAYRSRAFGSGRAGRKNQNLDPIAAAQEMGDAVIVYPDRATWMRLKTARPGVAAIVGGLAADMAQASLDDEGNA